MQLVLGHIQSQIDEVNLFFNFRFSSTNHTALD